MLKAIDLSNWDHNSANMHQNDGLADGVTLVDVKFSHCLLVDKYLRTVVVKGGTLRHCRLEFCNLRKATFERVDFTGSVFMSCDLKRASFNACTLWYTSFDRCLLDYDAVLASEPNETNLKRHFLRALRLNAISTGDKEWADRLLLRELRAERDDLWNIVWPTSDYYRTSYETHDRFESAWRLVLHWWSNILWGHGVSLWRLVTSGVAAVALFALLCWTLPAQYVVAATPPPRTLGFTEALYYSVIAFTTGGFGDILPSNAVARVITATEGVVGVVFLGFFAATVYRRLSR